MRNTTTQTLQQTKDTQNHPKTIPPNEYTTADDRQHNTSTKNSANSMIPSSLNTSTNSSQSTWNLRMHDYIKSFFTLNSNWLPSPYHLTISTIFTKSSSRETKLQNMKHSQNSPANYKYTPLVVTQHPIPTMSNPLHQIPQTQLRPTGNDEPTSTLTERNNRNQTLLLF